MEVSTASYVTTVVIGIIITLVVGQLLRRVGFDFLWQVYGDRAMTSSLNDLLVTLFHLIALGLLGPAGLSAKVYRELMTDPSGSRCGGLGRVRRSASVGQAATARRASSSSAAGTAALARMG